MLADRCVSSTRLGANFSSSRFVPRARPCTRSTDSEWGFRDAQGRYRRGRHTRSRYLPACSSSAGGVIRGCRRCCADSSIRRSRGSVQRRARVRLDFCALPGQPTRAVDRGRGQPEQFAGGGRGDRRTARDPARNTDRHRSAGRPSRRARGIGEWASRRRRRAEAVSPDWNR